MSVILFASVVRARDGLPLSASTDHEQNMSVQETKKYLKVLSRKLEQVPDRCTLRRGPHHVNFISSLGVSYMMLCSESYPSVLAFCFLDELQKEFITTYEMTHINSAIRPYSFIEFDNFIQKTKQRFNNPRSLTTKVSLADMQTEIRLRPPYQISLQELGLENGINHRKDPAYKGIAPHQRLEPLALTGIISCLLSLLCAGLNLIRGFHAVESLLQVDREESPLAVTLLHVKDIASCMTRVMMTSAVSLPSSWEQPPASTSVTCSRAARAGGTQSHSWHSA